jgi:hypothetical protein
MTPGRQQRSSEVPARLFGSWFPPAFLLSAHPRRPISTFATLLRRQFFECPKLDISDSGIDPAAKSTERGSQEPEDRAEPDCESTISRIALGLGSKLALVNSGAVVVSMATARRSCRDTEAIRNNTITIRAAHPTQGRLRRCMLNEVTIPIVKDRRQSQWHR